MTHSEGASPVTGEPAANVSHETSQPASPPPALPSGVRPALASALARKGFSTLTAVQQAVLDPALEGADLLVSAQTGSGKTVAFGLAFAPDMLGDYERLDAAGAPLALIVAPTRELALQVSRELAWLYEGAGARIATCVGGMDVRQERRALERGAHIVVGTPGRLADHVRRESLDLSQLRVAVLDEADEMLDLGFRDELEFILGAAPSSRRTLMFSATVPNAIAQLAQRYQKHARRVSTAAESAQHVDIDYRAMLVHDADVENAILNVLRYHEAQTAIVFCGTRAAVNHMSSRLTNRGFSVVALSGELSQKERSSALQALRDHRARVCVATDVAARGIDLPGLELVVHADLPRNAEALLHRSGRTGRAGRKGVCVLVAGMRNRRKLDRLLNDAGVRAEWSGAPTASDIERRDTERLMDSPLFEGEPGEDDIALGRMLLERHGAEKLAAALVRLKKSDLSAPEDIASVDVNQPGAGRTRADRKGAATGRDGPGRDGPGRDFGDDTRTARERFVEGGWVELSIGRNVAAEPRWILPMLCRQGGLTREDIGAIRIEPRTTFVQLSPRGLQMFLSGLGPGGMVQDGVEARRADGPPSDRGRGPRPAPGGARPQAGPRKPKWSPEDAPAAPPRKKKPKGKPGPRG